MDCVAGDRCRAYDRTRKAAAQLDPDEAPLCPWCLRVAERDVHALALDYRDLEQLLPPSIGQWHDGQPGSGADPPVPLRLGVGALQEDIAWVLAAWADVVCDNQRLSDPPVRVRPYTAVQVAVRILAPRLDVLARVRRAVLWSYPVCQAHGSWDSDGCARGPSERSGAAGVLDLGYLRARARTVLGLTRPVWRVPGICPDCRGDEVLCREVQGKDRDTVSCERCGESRPYADYERYVGQILWQHTGSAV